MFSQKSDVQTTGRTCGIRAYFDHRLQALYKHIFLIIMNTYLPKTKTIDVITFTAGSGGSRLAISYNGIKYRGDSPKTPFDYIAFVLELVLVVVPTFRKQQFFGESRVLEQGFQKRTQIKTSSQNLYAFDLEKAAENVYLELLQ